MTIPDLTLHAVLSLDDICQAASCLLEMLGKPAVLQDVFWENQVTQSIEALCTTAWKERSRHCTAQDYADDRLLQIPEFDRALQAVSLIGEADTPHFASVHSSLFSAPSDAIPCGVTGWEVSSFLAQHIS